MQGVGGGGGGGGWGGGGEGGGEGGRKNAREWRTPSVYIGIPKLEISFYYIQCYI